MPARHKRDAFLTEELGRQVEFVPLCPEVEIGLGVPRPPLHLERRGDDVRMVVTDSGEDLTGRMRAWAVGAAERIAAADIDGYVLKRGSPSCGRERVKLYDEDGSYAAVGRGLCRGLDFHALLELFDLLAHVLCFRSVVPRFRLGGAHGIPFVAEGRVAPEPDRCSVCTVASSHSIRRSRGSGHRAEVANVA